MSTDVGKALVDVEPSAAGFATKLGGLLAGSKVGSVLSKSGSAGGKAFSLGLGGAIAVGGLLAKVGSDFHSAFATIRTETGATGKRLEGLKKDFDAVLQKTPASFGDVASAISLVNKRLGLTGKPLDDVALSVIRLSRITKTDLNGNLQAATGLLSQWNIGAAQSVPTLDLLFRASQKSGVSVADLASQLTGAGVQLRSVGLNLRDSTALLALLGKAGLGASDVLPAISRAMATAAKEGKPANVVFRDTFAAIKNAPSDTVAAAKALDVFGARAGPKLAALIREGKLSWDDFSKSIAKGDSIEKASTDVSTWSGKLGVLKNKLAVELEPTATKTFDSIGKALVAMTPTIAVFIRLIGQVVTIVSKVPGPVLGAVAGAAALGFTVSKLIVPFGKAVKAIKLVGGALKWMGTLVMENPWILLIAATVLLVIVIVKNWDKIKRFLGAAWNWIKTTATNIWNSLKDFFVRWWPVILTVMTGGVGLIVAVIIKNWTTIKNTTVGIWNAVFGFLSKVWGAIAGEVTHFVGVWVGRFEAAWTNILTFIQPVVALIQKVIGVAWAAISTIFSVYVKVWTTIFSVGWAAIQKVVQVATAVIGVVVGAMRTTISTVFGVIAGIVAKFAGPWNTAKAAVSTVVGGIIGLAEKLRDRVIAAVKGLIDWVAKNAKKLLGPLGKIVDLGGKALGIAGKVGSGIGHVLGFAKGGTTPVNRPFWVGERGPELVTSTKRLRVHPADVSRELILGASSRSSSSLPPWHFEQTNYLGSAYDLQELDVVNRKLGMRVKIAAAAAGV